MPPVRLVNIYSTSIIQLYVKLMYTTNEYFVIYGKKIPSIEGQLMFRLAPKQMVLFIIELIKLFE